MHDKYYFTVAVWSTSYTVASYVVLLRDKTVSFQGILIKCITVFLSCTQYLFGMLDANFNILCDPVDYSNNPKALRVSGSILFMNVHVCMD